MMPSLRLLFFVALAAAFVVQTACTTGPEPQSSAPEEDDETRQPSDLETEAVIGEGSAEAPRPAVLSGSPAEEAARALAEDGSGTELAGERIQGRLTVAAQGVTAPQIGEPAASVMVCDPGLQCPGACETGRCLQRCRGGSACEFTCDGGACAQVCEIGARCSFGCAGGQCVQTCPIDDCEARCEGGGCVATMNAPPREGSGTSVPP